MNIGNEIFGKNLNDQDNPVKIGIGKNNPIYTLDVKGTARIDTVPTITNATTTKALVKNPSKGQISEQAFIPYPGASVNADLSTNPLSVASLTSSEDIIVNGWRIGRVPGDGKETNQAVGFEVLNSNTDGIWNSAFGYQSLKNNKNEGFYNSAFGTYTLLKNEVGSFNSAFGTTALNKNISGHNNTANGYQALFNSQTGHANTASGANSLTYSSGGYNTAFGSSAGLNLLSGDYNIAIGANTFFTNDTASYQFNIGNEIYGKYVGDPENAVLIGIGTNSPTETLDINGTMNVGGIYIGNGKGNLSSNQAMGNQSLFSNTYGVYNTAIGYFSLRNNTTGSFNTANGYTALILNESGGCNTSFGYQTLYNNYTGSNNTTIGASALINSTGNYNTALGNNAGLNLYGGNGNIAIGSDAHFQAQSGDNQLVIANFIYGQDINNRSNGQLAIGTTTFNSNTRLTVAGNISATGNISAYETLSSSDRRFKKDIQGINLGLKEVLQLKPSSYYWNTKNERMTNADPTKLQYGFIAQELETVIPAVVSGDGSEKDYKSVNYEALIPVLTKAIQKLEEMVQGLKKEIEILKKGK
ncbi:MAG: hypothetical protein RIR51_1834 [Bacteroidota bacterium]